MRDLEDLERLLSSGTPLLFVETTDPGRVEVLFGRMRHRSPLPNYRWSLARGLTGTDSVPGATSRPQEALAAILAHARPGVFLMFDLARYLDDAVVVSQLREIALRHEASAQTLLIIGSGMTIPADLRALSAKIELSLPSSAELEALIHQEAVAWGERQQRRVQATRETIAMLVRHLAGLTHGDARRLVRAAIRDDGVLDHHDIGRMQAEKHQLLDRGGVVSFELDTARPEDVAGLRNLKRWLSERRDVFLGSEAAAGLDPPKGVLLLGVQGGGKSLAAKSVAGAWGVPLLRLDFAALYNKYYGETERNLRDALSTASAMAPCVLWIDEIEKGLASEGDDGGPGKRILGTLLTWMAERRERTFLVATANDISALPPELMRKGRFDEIFFVDLPNPEVREAIFAIHLRKRGRDPGHFDLTVLADATEGYSGAEIEQAVVAALYSAKARDEALASTHISEQIASTKPLSVVMAERIAHLRAWAAERTVMAD